LLSPATYLFWLLCRLLNTIDETSHSYIGISAHHGFSYRLRTNANALMFNERLMSWQDSMGSTVIQTVIIDARDLGGIQYSSQKERRQIEDKGTVQAYFNSSIDGNMRRNLNSGFAFIQLDEVLSVPEETWAKGIATRALTYPCAWSGRTTCSCFGVVFDSDDKGFTEGGLAVLRTVPRG
jgi:hypothetical protein